MPIVDRGVVLDTRISASPSGLRDLVEEFLCVNFFDYRVVNARTQSVLLAVLDRAHEVIVDAHGVVGVLVLDADDVLATKIHIKASITQYTDFFLFAFLGFNEFFDVGVVDVQHNHLGRTPSRATGLDCSCGCVRATHEGDWA